MTIGVVLHPYEEDKPSGLGHYILELTEHLLALDRENNYIIFTKKKPRATPPFGGSNWRLVPLGFGNLWRELGFIFAPKVDVYLFGTPMLPLFYRLKKTITVTHDFPYHYLRADALRQRVLSFFLHYLHQHSLRRADRVVAISEYTKEEDIKLFAVPAEKISVIYNGFRRVCLTPPARLSLPQPFFLTVGAVKERKNTLRIVEAFAEFKRRQKTEHKLVIVGKTGNAYSARVMESVERNKIKDEVVFFGHTADPQLSYLYRNATALVFPSLIESFGFPVLEAMDCGTAVITSRQGGVAEVVGDAALLVDPENVSAITQALEEITTNQKLRTDFIARGHQRAKNFSWEKTARAFLEEMRKLT